MVYRLPITSAHTTPIYSNKSPFPKIIPVKIFPKAADRVKNATLGGAHLPNLLPRERYSIHKDHRPIARANLEPLS